MSSLGSPSPFLIAGKKSYTIGRSLRFNSNDSTKLYRTPSSAGNRKTWTLSFWVKRGRLSVHGSTSGVQPMFNAYDGSSSRRFQLAFNTDDKFYYNQGGNSTSGLFTSDARFRDVSAWYHFVVVADYSNGTAANRVKVYVNGSQISLNISDSIENADGQWNGNWQHDIGAISDYFDGYLTEIYNIDGSALTPSSFGETDTLTGQWNPKQYEGSYGTNGFYLKFADNSGTTATTLGKDSSGNDHNWTPSNFSVTAGTTNDSLEDTPTNNYPTINPLDFGGDSANYQVTSNGNLEVKAQSNVWASSRATFHVKTGKWYWEVKLVSAASLRPFVGIIQSDVRLASNQTEQSNELGATSTGIVYWGLEYIRGGNNTSGTNTNVPTLSAGDIVGVALDMDNKKVFFSKNGTFFASQDPANSTGEIVAFSTTMQNATIAPATQTYNNTSQVAMNFGQRPFDYTPPTGYKKLNSKNLPSPTILDPTKYFDTTLFTGNGSTGQSITSLNFKPDFLWFKNRGGTSWHALFDSVRGRAKGVSSNVTNTEYTSGGTQDLISFNSNGFSLGSTYAWGSVNGNNNSLVAWAWDAGETDSKTYTVTVVSDSGNKYRFDGFGTSAVTLDLAEGGTYTFNYPSAHPLRFSTTSDGTHGGGSEYTTGVSSYGDSVTITVAASAPTLYYYCTQHSGMGGQVNTNSTLGSSNFDGSIQTTVKANTTSGFSVVTYESPNNASDQTVGHGLGVKPDFILVKNRDNTFNWDIYHSELGYNASLIFTSAATRSGAFSSEPTTSVYGSKHNYTHVSTNKYVAYCFNEVSGYSKFGKYIGKNYSSNDGGNFVFTGFRPAFVLIKRTNDTENWALWDSKRDSGINPNGYMLRPDSNTDEGGNVSGHYIDILSNGFKIRNNDSKSGTASSTYVYICFAESPFKYARAR